ncbi:MAG: hypothetical protein AB8H12_11875, partial [Lewinella sp.]
IMINDGSINPTLMFYARRRGWTVTNDILTKYEWMNGYRAQGLKFLVVDRRRFSDTLPYKLLSEDELFRVYDVSEEVE